MAKHDSAPRVAIACQGGGSHTAFTAGVLRKLLTVKAEGRHNFDIIGLSGSSGGAICALLAWYGLLSNDIYKAISLLDSFWRANSTYAPWDRFLNRCLVQTNRWFANIGGAPLISPHFFPCHAPDQLRAMLESHVDFGTLDKLVKPWSPLLLVGAADVLSGEFKAFSSRRDRMTVDMILASAAIPTIFKAVHVEGRLYWDGLFSQNPPVRELPTERPDEIWIIAINPQTRRTEPRSVPEISDRRNELAGNLSLTQEVQFIEKMNRWVYEGSLARTKHQPVELRWIQMLRELDAESKLDRDPSFIQDMIAYGEQQAEAFLQEREESSRTVVRRMAYA